MPFTPKAWQDSPSIATPISAAALVDLENRVTAASVPLVSKDVASGVAGLDAAGLLKVPELPPSVPLLTTANTFTQAQTFKGDFAFTLQNGAGATFIRAQNDAGAGKQAGALYYFGTNGLGPGGMACGVGLDVSAVVPYRDLVVGYKALADGSVSDPDGLYQSNGGAGPSSWAAGMSQPGDSGASYRFKVYRGASTQGGIQITCSTADTAYPFCVTDLNPYNRLFLDPAGGNTFALTMRGDATTFQPILLVQALATGNAEQFRITANGALQFGGDGTTLMKRTAAGLVNVANHFTTGGYVGVGGVFAGAGSATVPAATLDVAQTGTGLSTLFVRNANGGARVANATTGEALFGNFAASNVLTLGNSAVNWNAIGFYGHAAVAQPAAPVTLADVIAIIRGCGLSA